MTTGITKEQIKYAYTQASNATAAAKVLGINPSTFRRYASAYGLYVTNQGGRGEVGRPPRTKRSTEDLLKANVFIGSAKLKERLLKEGLIENKCEECSMLPVWNNRPITFHLDHIDGDRMNNVQSNLRMLCPNCHS